MVRVATVAMWLSTKAIERPPETSLIRRLYSPPYELQSLRRRSSLIARSVPDGFGFGLLNLVPHDHAIDSFNHDLLHIIYGHQFTSWLARYFARS